MKPHYGIIGRLYKTKRDDIYVTAYLHRDCWRYNQNTHTIPAGTTVLVIAQSTFVHTLVALAGEQLVFIYRDLLESI